MSSREHTPYDLNEARGAGEASHETAQATREALLSARLRTEGDVEAQRRWQREGSAAERHAKAAFDLLAIHRDRVSVDTETRSPSHPYRSLGLPETDALVSDLVRAAQDTEFNPIDQWRREVVEKLRHYQAAPTPPESSTPEEGALAPETDVLRLLASPETPSSMRGEFWDKEISGLIEYAHRRDLAMLRETPPHPPSHLTGLRSPLPQGEGEEKEGVPELELPPPSQDKLKMSMDKMQELKEGEKPRGYFSVHPFWGGYVREQVYERYEGGDQWGRSERRYEPAPNPQGLLKEERVYRGIVRGGEITELPMYYGFVADPATLRASGKAKILIDEEGLYVIDARAAQEVVRFTITIGQPKGWVPARSRVKPPEGLAVAHPWLGNQSRPAVDGLTGDTMQKSRAVKRFVQGTLTYSDDETLNAVYLADPEGYFSAIEKHKKADCDVSNGYGANLRSAGKIKARMVAGHYVKMKDADGAAVMHSGSRHAWNETWDEVGQEWVRFDDTPPKDPTLDEDRPDEMSEDESGPGDYGEQDAKQITEEEFTAFKEKIEEAKRKAQEATASPEERQNKEFAEKAGCTPEQAKRVRQKIAEARALRDAQGRNVRDSMAEEFQKIVDSNLKDVVEYRGPVTRSQGDELDDKKMAAKDVRAGVADPLGYAREVIEQKITQEYGGMDVWLVVDRSGSMDEIDPLTNRPKKEEQQLAGFLTLDGVNAFSYKTEAAARQDLLLSPLSVRTGVVAFQGGNADVIKPSSGTWTEKEQYEVWSKMESNIGGGTPAHLGLMKVRAEIERLRAGDKKRPGPPYQKPRLQVVMVFMDGGVDNEAAYLAEQKKLEDMGVYVSSWGMTESARTVEAYPEGHCVVSAREMIDPIAKHIVARAQELKIRAQGDAS